MSFLSSLFRIDICGHKAGVLRSEGFLYVSLQWQKRTCKTLRPVFSVLKNGKWRVDVPK